MNAHSAPQFVSSATTSAASAPSKLRVQLAHPCPIVCAGLAAILTSENGFDIDATAGFPTDVEKDCVVITDYETAMQAAHARRPGQRQAPSVLVFTTRQTEWEVQQAISNGVQGYLLQGCSAVELVCCLRKLACGFPYISPMVKHRLIEALGRTALTPRETDVLGVLARGLPGKLIGRELGVSVGTVKSHIKNIMQKLDAATRTQVVVVAIERGLLPAPSGTARMEKSPAGRGVTPSPAVASLIASHDMLHAL